MKIICKVEGAECPEGLKICCGTCEHQDTCKQACDSAKMSYEDCVEAEIVTDELMQFESAVPDAIRKITTLVQMKKDLDEQEKLLKQELLKAMEAYGVKSFETDQIKMTYVAPTTKTAIDSAKLKK